MSDMVSNQHGLRSFADTQKLILEMRKRPVLYNPNLEAYGDRILRDILWKEVYASIIENWNALSYNEKKLKGLEVRHRWRVLKAGYSRALVTQSKYGRSAKQSKNVHFKSMSFLKDIMSKTTVSDNSKETISADEENIKSEQASINEISSSNPTMTHGSHIEDVKIQTQCRTETEFPRPMPYETSTHHKVNDIIQDNRRDILKDIVSKDIVSKDNRRDIVNDKLNDEFDEDKHFTMMLMPMLKKLNDRQKHNAKIRILIAMESVRNLGSSGVVPQHQWDGFENKYTFPHFPLDQVMDPFPTI